MFDFWFLSPGLDFWSAVAILASDIFAILIILPFREISHIWLSHFFSGYKFELKHYPLLDFFDPIGSLCMLLFGYGWPKRFPYFIDQPSSRLEYVLVYLIGSAFTFLSSILFNIVLNLLIITKVTGISWVAWIVKFINNLILVNIRLTVINLLPIPNLDGFKICEAFIPRRLIDSYLRYQFVIGLTLSFMLIMGVFNFPIMIMESLVFGLVHFISRIPFVFFL